MEWKEISIYKGKYINKSLNNMAQNKYRNFISRNKIKIKVFIVGIKKNIYCLWLFKSCFFYFFFYLIDFLRVFFVEKHILYIAVLVKVLIHFLKLSVRQINHWTGCEVFFCLVALAHLVVQQFLRCDIISGTIVY